MQEARRQTVQKSWPNLVAQKKECRKACSKLAINKTNRGKNKDDNKKN